MGTADLPIREITRDELLAAMRNGERFVLIDVLLHDHFERVHLPGAINVPVTLIRDLAPLLFGRHDRLIVYCASFECSASRTAANILMQLGFTDVQDYQGGIRDWEEGDQPVVRGDAEKLSEQ